MAKPPQEKPPAHAVSFIGAPCQIEIKNGVQRTVRGRTRVLNLPVHAKPNGRSAVMLPDGNEVEF